jgi:hypothetical protein
MAAQLSHQAAEMLSSVVRNRHGPQSDTKQDHSFPRNATAEDLANLRRVSGDVPKIVWLVAFTGAAQKFAFYGTTIPWRKVASLFIAVYWLTQIRKLSTEPAWKLSTWRP